MKAFTLRCLIPCVLCSMILCFSNPDVYQGEYVSSKGSVVVELFTSEGCSSCPPADELVAKLITDYPVGVYVLTFHVDYWDRLGWKDRFSSELYTARQNKYARAFHLSTIYTPQVIINGKTEFVGSDKNKLYETVNKELELNVNKYLVIYAALIGNDKILVKYKVSAPVTESLNLAIVQRQAQTSIKSGENGGRILSHVHIVRNFQTISKPANQGEVTVDVPHDTPLKDLIVIGFLQDRNYRITAASETPVLR